MAITGRIDLVHLNNSRDEFGSSRDRHANVTSGTIDPDVLVEVLAAAEAHRPSWRHRPRARPRTSRTWSEALGATRK